MQVKCVALVPYLEIGLSSLCRTTEYEQDMSISYIHTKHWFFHSHISGIAVLSENVNIWKQRIFLSVWYVINCTMQGCSANHSHSVVSKWNSITFGDWHYKAVQSSQRWSMETEWQWFPEPATSIDPWLQGNALGVSSKCGGKSPLSVACECWPWVTVLWVIWQITFIFWYGHLEAGRRQRPVEDEELIYVLWSVMGTK